MADFSGMDKKVLGGEQGEGVMIEQVVVKNDERKAGDPDVYIELMGVAKTKLRDNYNPLAGWDELPEPIPVSERWKVTLADDKEVDNEILTERLNRELQPNPPLVDDGESWERLLEGSKDSIHKQLVGAKFFFQARLNQKKVVQPPAVLGESPSDYFYNLVTVAKREEGHIEKGGATIREILAKKKAKKEAVPVWTPPAD